MDRKLTGLSARYEILSPPKVISKIEVSLDKSRMLRDHTSNLMKTLPRVDQIDYALQLQHEKPKNR